jgi:hypothetical protein
MCLAGRTQTPPPESSRQLRNFTPFPPFLHLPLHQLNTNHIRCRTHLFLSRAAQSIFLSFERICPPLVTLRWFVPPYWFVYHEQRQHSTRSHFHITELCYRTPCHLEKSTPIPARPSTTGSSRRKCRHAMPSIRRRGLAQ